MPIWRRFDLHWSVLAELRVLIMHVCFPTLPAIAGSSTVPSTPPGSSAAVATPRGDANSRLAHEQLVAKAKAGGIDLYFVGDSIIRRWGCTDAVWAQNFANWK